MHSWRPDGKNARKNNAQNKSKIPFVSVCVYTDNMWRMSKHGKIASFIMLQVLSHDSKHTCTSLLPCFNVSMC